MKMLSNVYGVNQNSTVNKQAQKNFGARLHLSNAALDYYSKQMHIHRIELRQALGQIFAMKTKGVDGTLYVDKHGNTTTLVQGRRGNSSTSSFLDGKFNDILSDNGFACWKFINLVCKPEYSKNIHYWG